jgi:hypothetical protein
MSTTSVLTAVVVILSCLLVVQSVSTASSAPQVLCRKDGLTYSLGARVKTQKGDIRCVCTTADWTPEPKQ